MHRDLPIFGYIPTANITASHWHRLWACHLKKTIEQSKGNKIIPMTSVDSGKLREITPDVAYYTNQIVNLIMIGEPNSSWVLVDAGMPGSGDEIIEVAQERYGRDNPPSAIILTHGHFDHVGSIVALLSKWNVPVYAHPMEFLF